MKYTLIKFLVLSLFFSATNDKTQGLNVNKLSFFWNSLL